MIIEPGSLSMLARELRGRAELDLKRDIQLPARMFGRASRSVWFPNPEPILNGDDAAALPDGDGFVLFAAEGMRSEFLAIDPWFCGFCSVMVNLNDIAAMGGRPWAITDVLFMGTGENERVLEGMRFASEVFGVPIVGGHTSRVSGASFLAVSVLGKAKRLISAHQARPGQHLLVAVDLRGTFRGLGGNFNAASTASPSQLRRQLALLPELAEAGLVSAGKDISMAGVCGSLLMMLETSGVGATLDLQRLPAPANAEPFRWLNAFPSFGFVLSVEPDSVGEVCARFEQLGVTCAATGEVTNHARLELSYGSERANYWELSEALTGFGASGAHTSAR
ncbi:MAG TPA: sll0787 family AIR synthase-like protein [Polyangiaceae bacterium]|nr:sll0787 family AIR synthase-like protein [Polyangiaceae bacterium]